jgi:hypothetical protein
LFDGLSEWVAVGPFTPIAAKNILVTCTSNWPDACPLAVVHPTPRALILAAYGWLKGVISCVGGNRCVQLSHNFRPSPLDLCKLALQGYAAMFKAISEALGFSYEMSFWELHFISS